ncbi:MAG: UDP-N-acetylmuramoyl-tripeptide--D-alanyl-D-alanine ligase [Rickettsiales bacterium]|jgi:UDP-N-acetylmuramoyl-tripeptide--D-alanyl-D-alanine ligase
MSALWAVADAIKATGGTSENDWCAWRVEIDSRKVQAGDLFVAVKGDNFDGHDYVADAFAKGAIAAVVSRKLEISGNQLLVADTFKALDDLGKYNRNRSNAKIIGITGSVGKTSTKEMMKLALAAHGKTYATTGNYNNHIGTPLNLANLPLDAEFAVFEMGMNHVGEIAHLTNMVRPHIALITGVAAVHLEFFPSVDEIANAKAEIFEGLESGGIAIINADQHYFADIKYSKVTFGENEKADCRLLVYKPTISGCEVSAKIMGEGFNYTLAATGKHWAVISLSVLAVVHVLGLDVCKSAAALVGFAEVEGRGRVEKITVAGGQFLLIDDSYNASPASMVAAFVKTNEVWQAQGKKGRKIALLGDMLELGESSPEIHAKLAENLLEQGFDKVYTIGNLMKYLHDAIPPDLRAEHASSAVALLHALDGVFVADDVVLIKGSHGSKIYELANLLKKEIFKDAV